MLSLNDRSSAQNEPVKPVNESSRSSRQQPDHPIGAWESLTLTTRVSSDNRAPGQGPSPAIKQFRGRLPLIAISHR